MSGSGFESLTYAILLYLPLTIILALMIGYFGVKIVGVMRSETGMSGFFNSFIQKFFGIKNFINKIVAFFWPDSNKIIENKIGLSVRTDTVLIGLGSIYILLMIILYNDFMYDKIKEKSSDLLYSIFNPILKFFFPNSWYSVKRNIRLKQQNSSNINFKEKFPLLLGGVGLLIGFSIFMYLLVNNYNESVIKSNGDKFNKTLHEKAQTYLYKTIFTGVSLAIFAGLLYYAATSNTAPKLLTSLLIAVSVIIILAAIFLVFKEQILKYLSNPFVRLLYNVIFVIPCLFIDLINFIYYELKTSPKSVYIIFLLELLIIGSIFVVPVLTKMFYLTIGKDKNFSKKIDAEITEVKIRKEKIKRAIKIVKNYNPKSGGFKKITVDGNSIKTEKVDPNSVRVIYNKKIKDAPTLRLFCMEFNREGNEGEIEYSGLMNVITGEIDWYKIKTISGWSSNFYTDEMKKQCIWLRNKSNKDFIKNYFGHKNKKPQVITSLPLNLEDLLNTYTNYQREELEKELKIRKEMLATKNLMNDKNDMFSLLMKYLGFVKDKVKDVMNNTDITASLSTSSASLNEGAWERILKKNLDNEENLFLLNRMLRGYGFKDPDNCVEITDRYKKRKCLEYHENIVKHVQINTKQLILFYNTLEELDNRLKDLDKMKKNSSNLFDKGIVCLKEPEYFRKKIYLTSHNKFLKLRPEQHSYNYSISCWFFLHSNPPNFKKAYNSYNKILNFNFEPVIAYNTKKNTLLIKSFKADDAKSNELVRVHKENKFKLQKWHNVVVNYIGGTIDVFLNGKLVGTVDRMAPYKTFNNLIVGQDKGNSGYICNVVYYPNFISNSKISLNYNYLKKKNPPVI